MTYLELSNEPGYMDDFVAACFLPHTDASLFPSVGGLKDRHRRWSAGAENCTCSTKICEVWTMEPIYGKNNKEELPLEYYLAKFQEGDPQEMAARCALPYDGGALDHAPAWGTPSRCPTRISPSRATGSPATPSGSCFCATCWTGAMPRPAAHTCTYREFPWGEVYLQQFTGRCIKRFAFSYGLKAGGAESRSWSAWAPGPFKGGM